MPFTRDMRPFRALRVSPRRSLGSCERSTNAIGHEADGGWGRRFVGTANSYGDSFVKGLTPDARAGGGHRCRLRGRAGWPGARRAVRLLYAGARVGYRLRRTGFRRESRAV